MNRFLKGTGFQLLSLRVDPRGFYQGGKGRQEHYSRKMRKMRKTLKVLKYL